MRWKSSQLFSLCASKQETTSTTRQFGKLTKSHRKFWTNWNVENLKPSVVVASCGVCWGATPLFAGNGRNERFCTPHYLFSTQICWCLQNIPVHLCTFLAAVFNMNIFLNFEQCGVLLAWLVVIRVQFSQICFSRRGCGGGERKLGQTNRHSRHSHTTTEAQVENTRAKK